MKTIDLISNYSPIGDVITFFTCIVLLFVICNALYYANDVCFTYLKRAIHFVLVGAIANFLFAFVVSYYPAFYLAIFILRDIYHVMLLLALGTFLVYTKQLLQISGNSVEFVSWMTFSIFSVGIILDVCSPFTHFGFYKKDGLWYDSVFIKPFTFVYIYTLALLAVVFVLYSNRMIKTVKQSLVATEIIIVLILFHQNMRATNSMTAFTFLLPIIIVLILLHSKPYEANTGAVGKDSFDVFLKHTKRKGYSIDYMMLKLDTRVNREIPAELGKTMNSFWHKYFSDAALFSLDEGVYVLAINRRKKNGNTEAKIKELVNERLSEYYDKYRIQYHFLGLIDIDFINNIDELKDIMNYFMNGEHTNSTYITTADDIEKIRELTRTKECLRDIEAQQNLHDDRIVVMCQPVKNLKTGKYDTAEALMRMMVDGKMIFPDIFIPMAERAGFIHTLSKIILNKVCYQIKEMMDDGYEFERISVNFSALEICEPSFVSEVINIISANHIPYDKIAIEITESQDDSDYKCVREQIQMLKEYGIKVYLDDYGTGYSNFDRILGLGIDIIKFDRSLLLVAENSEKISHSIEHFAQAFKELGFKILFEGVENEVHENLCIGYGADYLQGYKFSKPIPIVQLRDFVEKKA